LTAPVLLPVPRLLLSDGLTALEYVGQLHPWWPDCSHRGHKPRVMRLSTSALFLYRAGGLVLDAVGVAGVSDLELIEGRKGRFLPRSELGWCGAVDDNDADCCLA
jgi:hypothetical protein